jgi:hypothetical protein
MGFKLIGVETSPMDPHKVRLAVLSAGLLGVESMKRDFVAENFENKLSERN